MKMFLKRSTFSLLTLILFGWNSFMKSSSARISRSHNNGNGNVDADSATLLDGQVIVKLNDGSVSDRKLQVASIAESLLQPISDNSEILFVYSNVFKGFAATGVSEEYASVLQSDSRVEYVSKNGLVHGFASQSKPVWNLDRIDQMYVPLSNSYSYNATGSGVNVYILDSGIMSDHSEFKTSTGSSRVKCGYSAIKNEGCTDFHGHGTHVAGTVGGRTFGVAKSVDLINVKVLNATGYGSYAGIIAGVDYVIGRKKLYPTKPMVINMSLGGLVDTLLNKAVTKAVRRGIFVVVAAGNSHIDACSFSPASAKEVVTVAATDSYDVSTWFSNEGPCVSIFAPGQDIISASNECTTCWISKDGTSMAAPHVAGVAAQILQKRPGASPAAVWSTISNAAVEDIVQPYYYDYSLLDGTPNLFLRTIF